MSCLSQKINSRVSVNLISAGVAEPRACMDQFIIKNFNWSCSTLSVPSPGTWERHKTSHPKVQRMIEHVNRKCGWLNFSNMTTALNSTAAFSGIRWRKCWRWHDPKGIGLVWLQKLSLLIQGHYWCLVSHLHTLPPKPLMRHCLCRCQ